MEEKKSADWFAPEVRTVKDVSIVSSVRAWDPALLSGLLSIVAGRLSIVAVFKLLEFTTSAVQLIVDFVVVTYNAWKRLS